MQEEQPMPIEDVTRLCVHTITTKPWSLHEALDQYSSRGIGGISIWQDAISQLGAKRARHLLDQYEIQVVSYVRGGFFPAPDINARRKAIDQNKVMIEEAAILGAPLLVLVCGAHPDVPLATARDQIRSGIQEILPLAEAHGVKLGIEPLHPVYADTRSAISTMQQANDIIEELDSKWVGTVVDVYHVWWDNHLQREIERSAAMNALFAFHVCDWKVPTNDILFDRGLMGEGCINIPGIRKFVEDNGFSGFHEVEIFSNQYWKEDQSQFLDKIIDAYYHHV